MDFIKVIFGIAALIWLFRSERRTNWKKPENYKKILEENARKQPDTAFMSSEERKPTEPEHISTQQETPTEKKKEPVQDTPVSETPAAKEKTVESRGAADLFDAMYYMHQHERWGHEITKYHKLVQRLNQIHHNLTYGDIPEVDCPTVIRSLKKNDGHAHNWTTVYFTDYHYDDNGILRKIETTGPDYHKIPANEALMDVQVFDENGSILRHCPAFVDFSKSSFSKIPPVLAIHSGAIRNGQYGYERYELTMENIFSDTFEPKPFAKNGWENYWREYVPFAGEKRTVDYWYGRTFFPEAPGYEEWSFRFLKCSPKFEECLLQHLPFSECGDGMRWRQVGGTLYIEGEGKLKSHAFQEEDSIQKVVIAPGCTGIGNWVFAECSNLTDISIPDTVTHIGERAFYDCGSLACLTVPAGVKDIGPHAFDGVGYIRCMGPLYLRHHWGAKDGICEHSQHFVICGKEGRDTMTWHMEGDTLHIEGQGRLRCNPNNWFRDEIRHVVIASGCTAIADFVFRNHENLESIDLPDTLRTIGERAFAGSRLRAIVIPDSVTGIGKGAFDGCMYLEQVQLPRNLTQIHDDTFRGCISLRDVQIPDRVHYIGKSAFWRVHSINNLPSFLGSNRLRRYYGIRYRQKSGIGENAFGNVKKIKSCVIPSGVREIPYGAFRNTGIDDLELPAYLQEIGEYAFSCCNDLKSVAVPDSVTAIGRDAFRGVHHITYHGPAQSDDNWGALSRN